MGCGASLAEQQAGNAQVAGGLRVVPPTNTAGQGGANPAPAAAGRNQQGGRGGGGRGGAQQHRTLVPPASWRSATPMTQRELETAREEFWHTRVTGAPEMWGALRMAADAVRDGDCALANTILVASELSAPEGDLGLTYDIRGTRYEVKRFCFSTPANVLTGAAEMKVCDKKPGAADGESGGAGASGAASGAANPAAASGEQVPLKIRVCSAGVPRDITVSVPASSTIWNMKAQLQKDTGGQEGIPATEKAKVCGIDPVPGPDRQRVLYRGKELRDAQLLADCKIDPESVVQVFIRPALD